MLFHARDTCKLFWSRFFLVVVDTDLSLLLKAYSLLYSCCSNIKSLCIKTMSSLSSLRKVVNGGTKLKNQQPLEVNKIEMTEPSLFYEFFLYSMRWLLITFFISILKAQIWWHQYKIFSGSKRVRSVIHLWYLFVGAKDKWFQLFKHLPSHLSFLSSLILLLQ